MAKIVTVFRSRVKKETLAEYAPLAARMSELAQKMPGYLSHKGFVAEDGERVTIVEFASEEAHRALKVRAAQDSIRIRPHVHQADTFVQSHGS